MKLKELFKRAQLGCSNTMYDNIDKIGDNYIVFNVINKKKNIIKILNNLDDATKELVVLKDSGKIRYEKYFSNIKKTKIVKKEDKIPYEIGKKLEEYFNIVVIATNSSDKEDTIEIIIGFNDDSDCNDEMKAEINNFVNLFKNNYNYRLHFMN